MGRRRPPLSLSFFPSDPPSTINLRDQRLDTNTGTVSGRRCARAPHPSPTLRPSDHHCIAAPGDSLLSSRPQPVTTPHMAALAGCLAMDLRLPGHLGRTGTWSQGFPLYPSERILGVRAGSQSSKQDSAELCGNGHSERRRKQEKCLLILVLV